MGLKLDKATIEQLGRARRATVDKDDTTVVEGAGNREAIAARIKALKAQIEETTSDFDKEKLQERLAKLSGGVAVIEVGAASEVEQKEKKHRIEDAILATKAAVEEGIVPGGGVVLVLAQRAIADGLGLSGDELTGARIVEKALEAPLIQICANAGKVGELVLEKVRALPAGHGYDARGDRIVDMVGAGIVDPAKVTHEHPVHSGGHI